MDWVRQRVVSTRKNTLYFVLFFLCITFATLKRIDKTYWSAWVLLLVFVPMVLLSSVHVHPELEGGADTCHECIDHAVHRGHFATLKAHVDCPMCAFQNNLYQAADKQQLSIIPSFSSHAQVVVVPDLVLGTSIHQRNRAPPVTFCV